MGIVGALSIEAAAKHLNMRDGDGIVLGEGLHRRVSWVRSLPCWLKSAVPHLPVV